MHVFDKLVVAVVLLAAAATAHATDANPRTISVTGDAQVNVVPDQVEITLGVETLDKDLAKAKADNDTRVKKIFAVARAQGLDDKQIQTDQISIEPRYNDSGDRRTFVGYVVRKSVCLTLRDISKFEPLLGASLEAGANYLHGVQFSTTRLREHRDAARSMAMHAAKEKAVALAKDLGMTVGAARTINESGGGWSSNYGWWGGGRYGGMSQNVMQAASGPAAEAGNSTAPGTVQVDASVNVTFDLQP